MNEKSYTDWLSMSDDALLGQIGSFVRYHRLEKNITQNEVAKQAGISRSTLSMLERGEGTQLMNLIRVLRTLDLLYVMNVFETTPAIRPLEIARMERERRERARPTYGQTGEEGEEWQW